MSTIKVRLVGGPNAGNEMMWSGGEIIKVAERPDFPSRTELIAGKKVIPIEVSKVSINIFRYKIFPFNFAEGHKHYYAGSIEEQPVQVFNHLWYEYRKAVKRYAKENT